MSDSSPGQAPRLLHRLQIVVSSLTPIGARLHFMASWHRNAFSCISWNCPESNSSSIGIPSTARLQIPIYHKSHIATHHVVRLLRLRCHHLHQIGSRSILSLLYQSTESRCVQASLRKRQILLGSSALPTYLFIFHSPSIVATPSYFEAFKCI